MTTIKMDFDTIEINLGILLVWMENKAFVGLGSCDNIQTDKLTFE